MCGIAGFLRPGGFSAAATAPIVRDISARLSHRGPDDTGTWLDGESGIALGHTRLAILDLSSAGRQPMASESGRYVMVYNGEIYNHLDLRKELACSKQPLPGWRGHSDTETLLAAIDRWGIEGALRRAVGMFAFAVWDVQDHRLILARDRMGEKPLYYGWQNDHFLFASELKALRAHPAFRADVDPAVTALYFRYGYIPAPCSIYRNIFKLVPGTYVQITAKDAHGTLPECRRYWSLREVAEHGSSHRFAGDDEDAIRELDARLRDAIALQSVADVPLGAFLSGGVDSSAVVALMQCQSARPVKTFTIGFHEAPYNEAPYAKLVAQYLRTDHTEVYVAPREAMEVIPKLPAVYDEPFGDTSAIPTLLVSGVARQHVAVSLSGDSGDELFGGYPRYARVMGIWRMRDRIPSVWRRAVSHGLCSVSELGRGSAVARRAIRLATFLSSANVSECYDNYVAQRQDVHNPAYGAGHSHAPEADVRFLDGDLAGYDEMMYADSSTYLPDDILIKVDRAAMKTSLETRIPFLDHRVVEFAWTLPSQMKIRRGEGKWILKEVLRKHIPHRLVDRPKMGFGVPIGQWLRGPLRDWAEDLLASERLKAEGFLDPALVRQEWSQHLNGSSAGADRIWQILMYQAWLADPRC